MTDSFPFECPFWIFTKPTDVKVLGSLLSGKIETGERGPALFTDEALAEEYAEKNPGPPGFEPYKIESKLAFYGLLVAFEEKGYTHVFVDPTHRVSNIIPVADLRKRIAKAWIA